MPKIGTMLIALTFAGMTYAIDYRSSIKTQRISHYANEFVDFDVKYYGDEGYPYLTLKQPVTPYDDLHLMFYARTYDEQPNLLAHAPLSLCQLLHEEKYSNNHNTTQFHIPQILNLVGRTCPLEQERIRLYPYVLPATFTTPVNLGCGYMNVELRLMKCSEAIDDEAGQRICDTLLKSVTLALLTNDECEVDAEESHDEQEAIEGGWESVLGEYIGQTFTRALSSLYANTIMGRASERDADKGHWREGL